MNEKKVNHIFEQFGHMRALVIGDAMVDSYLWGTVERVSPEAPIPIVSVTQHESRLGGAANVSLNIQALGATPVLFSVIGNDNEGRRFMNLLEKKQLMNQGIFVDSNRITTVKSRIIGKGQHIARVDEESDEFISPGIEQALIDGIRHEIETRPVDVIIFVDYDKGVLTPALFQAVNEMALQKGIPTAVDPKKQNFPVYNNIGLFKPNFKEFVEGTGRAIEKGDFNTLRTVAHEFKEKRNFGLIFITLSELGVFISNGLKEQYYPAVIRHISDVSGAGDSVISVASLALAAELSPKTMALMSNIAGGLVCENLGVVPVNKNQLMLVMKSQKI